MRRFFQRLMRPAYRDDAQKPRLTPLMYEQYLPHADVQREQEWQEMIESVKEYVKAKHRAALAEIEALEQIGQTRSDRTRVR